MKKKKKHFIEGAGCLRSSWGRYPGCFSPRIGLKLTYGGIRVKQVNVLPSGGIVSCGSQGINGCKELKDAFGKNPQKKRKVQMKKKTPVSLKSMRICSGERRRGQKRGDLLERYGISVGGVDCRACGICSREPPSSTGSKSQSAGEKRTKRGGKLSALNERRGGAHLTDSRKIWERKKKKDGCRGSKEGNLASRRGSTDFPQKKGGSPKKNSTSRENSRLRAAMIYR